jgi:uncharacterized protein YnzC (UPF0291/DUF896 family)
MKKSICLEKTSMPLISDARYGEITEDSIQGYCEMLHSIFLTGIDPIRPVMDRQTEIRILLATAKMDKESKTEGHGNMDAEIGKLNIELAGLSKTTSVETRENFEEIYLAKLRKSVDDKIYNIEIFADTHGDISEENIDAFSKALVQIEASEARKFEISIPAGAREENADIKIRLNEAYVAARIAHFEKSSTAGAM